MKLGACLHGGGGPQVGEVACSGSPQPSCEHDQIKMRDYMERRLYQLIILETRQLNETTTTTITLIKESQSIQVFYKRFKGTQQATTSSSFSSLVADNALLVFLV